MKTLTKEEFERLYGTNATQEFSQPTPASGGFDFKAAGNVFTQAADDINLAKQNRVEQNNSMGSLLKAGATNFIQGGLSVPRAFGAGIMGTETAQNITGKAVEGLTSFGNVITPEPVKDYVGEIAMKTIEGYDMMSPQEQLNQRNKLGVAEVLSYFVGGSAAKTATAPVVTGTKELAKKTASLVSTPDDVVKQGKNLRQNIQSLVGEKSVEPQFKASAERAVTKPQTLESNKDFLTGSGKRAEDVVTKYDRYLTQSEQAINDIKIDPAISEVGSKMGDSFEEVIRQRQAVGKVLGSELNEWGKLRVSVKDSFNKIIEDLDGSGLSYNPQNRQLTSFQGNKFVPQEVDMLNSFVGRMRLLGDSPTVRDIDNFVSRMRTELDFAKGASGVMKTTNAERIITGAIASLKESLDPGKNGIQQLRKYWNANKTYSDLSDFVEEGAGYLGKKTQSGDFAKDASIAKSAVQSILNNGKKDWMLKLEALTGYNALDDAVIALQAMKDAGDFRGLSLLQAMKDGGIPVSKAGFAGAALDYGIGVGKRVIAGTPAEQTRAFLKSINAGAKKVDLKVPDKKIVVKAGVPKTKEITALEAKIAKNVDSQKAAIKANDFELVAKLKVVYQKLVTELKVLIEDYKKNGIPLGMSIRKSITPESVAKKADKEDIKFLAAVIDDIKGARMSPGANRLLDNMGLGKATDDEVVSFAKDVIDSKDGLSRQVKGATPNLLEEAKKYKSAEDFVKKTIPNKPVTTNVSNYGETKTYKILESSYNKKESSVVMPPKSVVFRGGNDGVYHSADLGTAEGYAMDNAPISAVDISGKKLANFQIFTNGTYASDPSVDLVSVLKKALDEGYDGLYSRDNYGEVILPTKSQLTDIWNKANGQK